MGKHIPARVRESFLRHDQVDSLDDIINDFSKTFDDVMDGLNTYETNRENPASDNDQNTTK